MHVRDKHGHWYVDYIHAADSTRLRYRTTGTYFRDGHGALCS